MKERRGGRKKNKGRPKKKEREFFEQRR